MSQVVGSNNSYKPITNTAWVRALLCKLQKRCTRLAAASDKAYQLLAHGWWFTPGTPVSSTTKTGRHDIAEILLKVAYQKSNQSKLKDQLRVLVQLCFIKRNGQIPCARTEQILFCKKNHSDSTKKFSETDIINKLEFLIDNIFAMFGGRVFQQTVGIPMGTNCTPLLADLFLYSYEADFIRRSHVSH